MTMSDRERRLLAETARSIEEQDPGLAAALKGWSEPTPEHVVRRRRTLARWGTRFRNLQLAPVRTSVAGGALFVVALLLTADFAPDSAPVPDPDTPITITNPVSPL